MPLVAVGSENYMLDQWGTSQALYASLHTAYSATGANEVTGGSPAYARQAITWNAASGGSKALASTYTFNVPATTVEFIGFWTAVTSGTFLGMFPNAAGLSAYEFTAPSSTSTFLAPGSAYSSNQTVVLFNSPGSTFPGGFTQGQVYYVKSPSGDSFQLSASSGPGAAVTVTSDGSGIIQYIAVEVYAGQGTFVLNTGSVSIT